jgi:fatty acid desaturase
MNYYKLDLKKYWIDFIVSSFLFALLFCLGSLYNITILYIISAILLYRAGAFTHEIAHQYKNPQIKTFKKVWDATLGLIIMQPSVRFAKPHITHHTTGIFGTEKDPQYPLIKSDIKLALTIFIALPWVLPIYNFLICAFNKIENNKLESILYKNIKFSKKEYKEIHYYETIYFWVVLLFIILAPLLTFKLYCVQVIAWFLSVLRIPLEHELKEYKDVSIYEDQKIDSKTHLSPLYIPIQPLGLRYHTVHHMFPKIPYYHLEKSHYEILSPLTNIS